ncbi:DUF4870 domain-containing protein [archaeon]
MPNTDSRAMAMLAYTFFWFSGGLVYLFSRNDEYARFHAMQSIAVFGLLTLVQTVLIASVLGILLLPVVWLLGVVLWAVLIVKAAQGERFGLPWAGGVAERHSVPHNA